MAKPKTLEQLRAEKEVVSRIFRKLVCSRWSK